jgi:hypothetical protein
LQFTNISVLFSLDDPIILYASRAVSVSFKYFPNFFLFCCQKKNRLNRFFKKIGVFRFYHLFNKPPDPMHAYTKQKVSAKVMFFYVLVRFLTVKVRRKT